MVTACACNQKRYHTRPCAAASQPPTPVRMAHAARLLATTGDKVEVIARSVGYANPFAFSNTFKRLTGFRPSDYRARPHVSLLHGSDS